MAGRRATLLLASQPLDGGVVRHVLDLVECLPRDRFELHVACPAESQLWKALAADPDVRLHPIGAHRRPAAGDLVSLVRLLGPVRRADVVHGHSSKAGFLLRVAAALTGRRAVCVFTPHAWSFWAVAGRARTLYLGLERVAAGWCRTIVAVSDAERADGLAAGIGLPEQYRVVPNGVALADFDRPRAPVPGRILFVGRLARQKRPDLALRALALVRARRPDAHLVFAGAGPLRGAVERLAHELGVADAVRFLGEHHDVPALLAEAECVLLTSDWEACPYSVLEAMAAGVPVVATAVGGLPELVAEGETGLLVVPGSAQSVAAGLAELLGDPERARALGTESRRVAHERYGREAMAARLVELYDELR